MKNSRFSEAQIVGILKELEAGTPATELGRRHGIPANTIRLWKEKYAGLEASDLARLKKLEAENAQTYDRARATLRNTTLLQSFHRFFAL